MNPIAETGLKLSVVQTARDTGDRLAALPDLSFETSPGSAAITVDVDRRRLFQRLEGFGGAFTEAGAFVLSKLSPARREEVLRAYFDEQTGLRYSFCRTHINSCDFALGNYAYNEVGGDYELRHFDISRDQKYLIPFIQEALRVRGKSIQLLASPWSPPAWMKTNGEMNNGGKLKRDCLAAWAQYFARYIKAYAAESIPVWGVTVQNEPEAAQRWDSCLYTGDEERDFVKYYLGPRLAADGLSHIKILIWDHNKDHIVDRASAVLSDPVAAEMVWGTGFHWYAGDHFEKLAEVQRRFPDHKLLATEGCQEGGVNPGSWPLGERYAHAIIGDLNHGSVGWIDWNMILDQQGGPNHVGNYCDAPIIADLQADRLHYQNAFYYIGHFSRWVTPGAVRVQSAVSRLGLEATAFRNPDGTTACVVLNRNDQAHVFQLHDQSTARYAQVSLPAHAILTLTW